MSKPVLAADAAAGAARRHVGFSPRSLRRCFRTLQCHNGVTRVFTVASLQVVRLLLSAGADKTGLNAEGRTAVQVAPP